MTTGTIRRWLWWGFLLWTTLMLIIVPFDIGEAQMKEWAIAASLRSFVGSILRAADAVWIVLAAAFLYFYVIGREGVIIARRAALTILVSCAIVLAIGVRSGFPFGPFIYTSHLGAKIVGVPFAVPLLWLVILCASRYVVLHFWEHASRRQIALGTALLAVITDGCMELVAWKIRAYWLWYFPLANTPEWPPLSNFVSWFWLVAVLTWFAFPAARPAGRHPQPLVVLLLINLLFGLTLVLRLPH